MCKQIETFSLSEEYRNGVIYINGDKIDVREYLKGNVVIIEEDEKKQNDFFGLLEFDKTL